MRLMTTAAGSVEGVNSNSGSATASSTRHKMALLSSKGSRISALYLLLVWTSARYSLRLRHHHKVARLYFQHTMKHKITIQSEILMNTHDFASVRSPTQGMTYPQRLYCNYRHTMTLLFLCFVCGSCQGRLRLQA